MWRGMVAVSYAEKRGNYFQLVFSNAKEVAKVVCM